MGIVGQHWQLSVIPEPLYQFFYKHISGWENALILRNGNTTKGEKLEQRTSQSTPI